MIKLEFNGDTKMAAEACRFKVAARNDRAIMQSKDTRGYFNAYVRVGLNQS